MLPPKSEQSKKLVQNTACFLQFDHVNNVNFNLEIKASKCIISVMNWGELSYYFSVTSRMQKCRIRSGQV